MEFLGNYLLFSKDTNLVWNGINKMFFVYKISAYFGISGETQDYYFSAHYDYVKRLPTALFLMTISHCSAATTVMLRWTHSM